MNINTILNPGKFRRVLPYAELGECFPRGIRPQDIDGECEINGHFVWFEWSEAEPTFSGGDWLAALKRVWLAGNRGALVYVQHLDRCKDRVELADVTRFWIVRRRRWLVWHEDFVRARGPFDGKRLLDCLREWAAMAEEKPNQFDFGYQSGPDAGAFYVDNNQRAVMRVIDTRIVE